MATKIDTLERDVVLVENAHIRPMMGVEILESLPSRHIPYELVDPYILVHEGVIEITPERAKLEEGSLLKLRTGSGVLHAEGIGQDELREGKAGTQMRGVLFW